MRISYSVSQFQYFTPCFYLNVQYDHRYDLQVFTISLNFQEVVIGEEEEGEVQGGEVGMVAIHQDCQENRLACGMPQEGKGTGQTEN